MATMNVSLPEEMKDWVNGRSDDGAYSNASDYVRDLIRRDQVKVERITHLQTLIDQGIASGVGRRSMDEIREEAERRLRLG